MNRTIYMACCIALLMGHGLVVGLLNSGSVSAAGAFIGAGLFAIAIEVGQSNPKV